MKTQNREERNYVDIQKLESLRKENGYSISYINSVILEYRNRDVYRKKCNGKLRFNIEDIVRLSNLYNVFIDDLLIFKEEEEI